jgi:hypothetical protein
MDPRNFDNTQDNNISPDIYLYTLNDISFYNRTQMMIHMNNLMNYLYILDIH